MACKQKSVVFGLVNRQTKQIKSFVVEPTAGVSQIASKKCLLPKIGCNVKAGANVITDSYHAYNNLKNNYKHDIIKHSAGETAGSRAKFVKIKNRERIC